MKECKRLSAYSAIRKNKCRIRVNGRELLSVSRQVIEKCTEYNLVSVTFALMLMTGRRTCEILNGASKFEEKGQYSLEFTGVAKRRGCNPILVIPVLTKSNHILAALKHVRTLQKNVSLSNREVSAKYQSLLSRNLCSQSPWKQCVRVHGLRGVYVCMALRLFDWDDASDAYVAMCILGHTGLQESLVYTTFHLGDDFVDEVFLGKGGFTQHPSTSYS
jgi:integrase